MGDHQILIHDGLLDERHVRVAHQRIVAQEEERLNRIGPFAGHGPEGRGGVRHVTAHDEVGVLLPPDPLGRLAKALLRPIGKSRVVLRAELLGFLFVGEHLMHFQRGLVDDVRVEPLQCLTAGHVHVAADRPQNGLQPDARRGVALHVRDRCPGDDRGPGGGVHPGGLSDHLRLTARELCHAFKRVLVDPLAQCFKANGPILYEVLVIEPFVDDDLQPAEHHGGVAAHLERQPDIGPLRARTLAGIGHDQLGATRLGGADGVVDGRPTVPTRVMAHEHDALGIAEVRHGVPAIGQPVHRRRVARAERHAADPVRRPHVIHEAPPHAVVRAGIPLAGRDRPGLGTVLRDDRLEPRTDIGHGLIPGDLLPLAGASLADALHGVQDPVRVRESLGRHDAFHADVVPEDRVVRGANFYHPSLLHFGHQGAGDVTGLTDCALDCHAVLRRSFLILGVFDFLRIKGGDGGHGQLL